MERINKILNKINEIGENNCYAVVFLNNDYTYMFHNNGMYDKLHEKTYGLLGYKNLKNAINSNDLFIRAEKIQLCCKTDSWTYFKD